MDFLDELRRQGSLESSGRFRLPRARHPLEVVLPFLSSAQERVRVSWSGGRLAVERDGERVLETEASQPEWAWLEERVQAAPIEVEVQGRRAATGVLLPECLVGRELGAWDGLFRLRRPLSALVTKQVPSELKGVLGVGRRVFSEAGPAARVTVVVDKIAVPLDEDLPEVSGVLAAPAFQAQGDELVKDRGYYRLLRLLTVQLEEMACELEGLAASGPGATRALARRALERLSS